MASWMHLVDHECWTSWISHWYSRAPLMFLLSIVIRNGTSWTPPCLDTTRYWGGGGGKYSYCPNAQPGWLLCETNCWARLWIFFGLIQPGSSVVESHGTPAPVGNCSSHFDTWWGLSYLLPFQSNLTLASWIYPLFPRRIGIAPRNSSLTSLFFWHGFLLLFFTSCRNNKFYQTTPAVPGQANKWDFYKPK